MSASSRPLKGLSVLLIDDDRLGAYRLHRDLVVAGARVAHGDLATAEPYIGAAALAAVIVHTGLNATDAQRLAGLLAACRAPWVAYGDAALSQDLGKPAAHVRERAVALLVAQLAALCATTRH